MGTWAFSAFLKCSDIAKVRREIDGIMESVGFHSTSRPEHGWITPLYGHFIGNSPVCLALFPGDGDWSVVKTSPAELMGDRIGKPGRPFLSVLCKRLKCPGFMHNIYDGSATLLMEALRNGRIAITGADYDALDTGVFTAYRGTKVKGDASAEFSLLTVDRALADVISGKTKLRNDTCDLDAFICNHLLGYPVDEWDNPSGDELVVNNFRLIPSRGIPGFKRRKFEEDFLYKNFKVPVEGAACLYFSR